jgi:hypothetical protein
LDAKPGENYSGIFFVSFEVQRTLNSFCSFVNLSSLSTQCKAVASLSGSMHRYLTAKFIQTCSDTTILMYLVCYLDGSSLLPYPITATW